MGDVPVTNDTFKFLDVRSPRTGLAGAQRYTISRQLLAFNTTPFEQSLKGVLPGDAKYQSSLVTLATSNGAPNPAIPVSGGFAADMQKLESILFDREIAPETRLARFLAALPPPAGDGTYLTPVASDAWDKFLAAVLLANSDKPALDTAVGMLSSLLRIAAAIFTTRTDPSGANLDVFTTASINIPTDLIDPEKLRATSQTSPRSYGDNSARIFQNDLVNRLVVLEAAADELQVILLERDYSTPTPPPAPVVPGPAPAGNDVLSTIAAEPLRVSVANARLSQSTRDLLVKEFGAKQQPGTLDELDLPTATARVCAEIERLGSQLFASARPAQILAVTRQLSLLKRELSTAGVVAPAKFERLTLLLSPPTLGDPGDPGKGVQGSVNVLGVGDLKVVKQTLLRYDPGEVANIENVLVGQTKERTHTVRQSTEDTLTVEQEKSVSTEKDLQTTDRFELSDESQNALKEQRQNEAGVTISASYGPVSISANTKFTDASSQEQSSKVSRQFAREVIDKSVEKVEQKVREERTRKTTLEVEEMNKYSQTAISKSVVGIYRWVDKIYWAQVVVYGKRMMLEFLLPEPSAVYVHSQAAQPPDPGAIKEPDALTISATDLTRYNYAAFAAHYAAQVDEPPPAVQVKKFTSRSNTDTQASKISLEDGLYGVTAGVSATWLASPNSRLLVQIADAVFDTAKPNWQPQWISGIAVGDIPLTVTANAAVSSYNVAGSVIAVPSDKAMQRWQLNTYKAIADAYQLRLTDYREYLASKRRSDPGVPVGEDSVNREIERRELQRACLETLTQQHFDGPSAITDNPVTGWPEIDFNKAAKQGKVVSFFQQSFEWEQMTYVFYPYFWGRQSSWASRLSMTGGDQLFTQFLTAGFARVVVPVRPAHESDLAYFLATGTVWSGTEPPVMGDSRYVSILDEIKESLDAPDGGITEGDPWQVKVPTSLVILDDSGQLPSWPRVQPGQGQFSPSEETCAGMPYNAAQWKDASTIADAIRKLGYAIDTNGSQDLALTAARRTIRAMQQRFNDLGAATVVGQSLRLDGIVGPCTLRALTYFDAMRSNGKWPGVG